MITKLKFNQKYENAHKSLRRRFSHHRRRRKKSRSLREESKKPEWKGILTVTDKPLVSLDILKNPHGAIVDFVLTRVVGGELAKIMVWHDNEWGYASMLVRHVISLIPFL